MASMASTTGFASFFLMPERKTTLSISSFFFISRLTSLVGEEETIFGVGAADVADFTAAALIADGLEGTAGFGFTGVDFTEFDFIGAVLRAAVVFVVFTAVLTMGCLPFVFILDTL